MKERGSVVAILALALLAVPSFAQNVFNATLEADQVVGGTSSTASGTATVTLNAARTAATYTITLVGLDLDHQQTPSNPDDDVVAFHFHAAPAGMNGGVVFGLISPNHDPDDQVIDPVAGTISGVWEDTDPSPLSGQLDNLLAGGLYLNVHTPEFPGGAIRGQVLPSNSTGSFQCNTWCTAGTNDFFPLWPGYSVVLEGEQEDDEGGMVEVSSTATVTTETQVVNGIRTRVFEERELEDGELVEVSRNYVAICRETGDIWYFGEAVDDYEGGVIVGHQGAWRAGMNGAVPGILMPGSPILGARYFEEMAPGVALDQAEVVAMGDEVTVPVGTFTDTLETQGTDPLNPLGGDTKVYARGVGNIVDQTLQLTHVNPPPCQPDGNTLCLNNGRFRVQAEWHDSQGGGGLGNTVVPCDDTGEFWFFSPNNTELIVKVLDACDLQGFHSFWVFAGGLTNVEVRLTVTDTVANETRVYENDLGTPFQPIADTGAFLTCDVGGGGGSGGGGDDDDDDDDDDDG